jgi:hypothetical protein
VGELAGRHQIEVEIHAVSMPRPEGVTPRASGTGRARQNHTSGTVYKGVQDQLGMVKQRWEFMQRQCRVQKELYQGLVALGKIIPAAQLTGKGGAGLLYDFCGRSHMKRFRISQRALPMLSFPLSSYQVRGNLSLSIILT